MTGKPRVLNPLLKCGSNASPGISLLMQHRSNDETRHRSVDAAEAIDTV